jgi:hypothetical protein
MDFLFHTGYRVGVPVEKFAGSSSVLTILFRVFVEKRGDEPTYFVQTVQVPTIGQDARGYGVIDGSFLVGQGNYRVDWLMRDLDGRVCSGSWQLEARVDAREGPLADIVVVETIQPVAANPFSPPVKIGSNQQDRRLAVKIIVNFASQNIKHSTLSATDIEGLAAILREIGKDPRIGSYSIVACSVSTQQILYRQQDGQQLDLPALGEAVRMVSPGKIDVKRLAVKRGEAEFLTNLLMEEMRSDRPDALIFVGPKYPLDGELSSEVVAMLKNAAYPVFYLMYIRDPFFFPWPDAIGRVVRRLHGVEYRVSRPGDLFNAWSDVLARIKSKQTVISDLQ